MDSAGKDRLYEQELELTKLKLKRKQEQADIMDGDAKKPKKSNIPNALYDRF